MRFSAKPLLLAALAAALLSPASATAAADDWIVVLKPGADPAAVATDHGRRHRAQVRQVYRHALRGYVATVADERVEGLRRDPRVQYVERDQVALAVAQTTPWGIDRIDADLSSTLAGNGSGAVAGVHAYVLDTGVDASHPDLNVVRHVNFAGGRNTDCNGHGTHVAGTLAARDNAGGVVGAAPGAPIVAVKVLDCKGAGSYSAIITAVDWVTANAQRPAVANMSLGGGASTALDDAVRRSAASGILYALAAGNESADACTKSPARAGAGSDNGIVTVAATDTAHRETPWSNFGSCVDLWAPGADILSTRPRGGTTTLSGTSMASPHVAGGAALYRSRQLAATPAEIEAALKRAAVQPGTVSRDGRILGVVNVGGF